MVVLMYTSKYKDEMKQEYHWYAQFEASKIIDFRSEGRGAIYIGNIYQAMELTHRGNPLGFNAVLDVSTEDDYEKRPDILYLRVPFPDGHEIPPEKFAQCMAFLKFCWEKNMTILVNCAAGISRSASVVVSFIYYQKLLVTKDMDKILDFVRACRPIVNPSSRVLGSCKKWLRYDATGNGYAITPPKDRLDNTVVAHLLSLHVDPECEVRSSILADDNRERHLLRCTCKPEGRLR